MKKNILSLGIFAVAILLFSCSGKTNKNDSLVGDNMSLECANKVVKYYDTSLALLKNMVREDDMKDVLKYMEGKDKSQIAPNITSPVISASDSVAIMNPDTCFDIATRQELQRAYSGLFDATQQFYANYNAFQACVKAGKNTKNSSAEKTRLLKANSTLSTKMTEDKQVIYDMLSTAAENAHKVISVKGQSKK